MNFPVDYSVFKTLFLVAVLPPVPMLVLAAWGGWRLKRRKRFGGWMVGLALLLVWLSATGGAAELLSRAAHLPPPLSPQQVQAMKTQKDGAVLVLGGGVNGFAPEYNGGSPRQRTAERLAYGVWLAKRTGWPLGFTGGVGWTARRPRLPESVIVARVAKEDYGLPLRWMEANSRDTRENAANTLPILAAAGVKQVVLVTDDAHMKRAVRAFEGVAAPLNIRIVPASIGVEFDGVSAFGDWVPSVEGFSRTRNLIYEMLAWWSGR